jgi:hypothetical protein
VRASKVNYNIPKSQRLSKLQKARGTTRLRELRHEIFRDADQSKQWMLPPSFFLPDSTIASVLDNFAMLTSEDKIKHLVRPPKHLTVYIPRIFEVLAELTPQFVTIAAERKAENAANRAARKKAELDHEEQEDEDVVMSDAEIPSHGLQ